jgi:hypothetical protein
MKLCSWTQGCAQQTSSEVELCEYHNKVCVDLLGESREAGKVAARRLLRRQRGAPGRRNVRSDLPN